MTIGFARLAKNDDMREDEETAVGLYYGFEARLCGQLLNLWNYRGLIIKWVANPISQEHARV